MGDGSDKVLERHAGGDQEPGHDGFRKEHVLRMLWLCFSILGS